MWIKSSDNLILEELMTILELIIQGKKKKKESREAGDSPFNLTAV